VRKTATGYSAFFRTLVEYTTPAQLEFGFEFSGLIMGQIQDRAAGIMPITDRQF
jgi:hypothetical protein